MNEKQACLSNELDGVDGVSNLKEREMSVKNKLNKTFQIDFDYFGFPLNALEIVDSDGFRFLNIRLTISYSKSEYDPGRIIDLINKYNSTSMCTKAFYKDDGDVDEFDISYNIEDVIEEGISLSEKILSKRMEMLVRSPRNIHKAMDGE